MKPDLGTIMLIVVIFYILQVIAFILQYSIDRAQRGAREWVIWSVLLVVGFSLILVRRAVPPRIMPPVVAVSNACLFVGHLFLYAGIERFLGRKLPRAPLFVIGSFFVVGTAVAIVALVDGNLSATVLYLSLAAVTFRIATALWSRSLPPIRSTARFLAALFLIQGAYLVIRSILAYAGFSNLAFFSPTIEQVILFLMPLCMGYLWSVSIIIMLNHTRVVEYRESQKNQDLIFNTHPNAIWIINLSDERIEAINDGFTRITGYDRKDAIGKTTVELGLWKEFPNRSEVLSIIRDVGFFEDIEASFATKLGEVKRGIISARRIALRGEAKIVAVMHDITARVEMEAALKASEEKFRLLVENSYDMIYTLDSSGVFTFVSPVSTRLLGYEPREMIGKRYSDFGHPEDIPACEAFLRKMAASGERQTGVEYRILHKNGYWLWHTSSVVPVFGEDGALSGFYGIDHDITERRQFQKELEKQATTDELTGLTNRRHFIALANAELRRANRMKHDLSLALIDIDRFKEINDAYGHAVGDQAIVFFTRIIQGHIRDIDVLSRFGGDEFVILFPETSPDHASVVLERLQSALANTPFLETDPPLAMSASAGLTSLGRASEGVDTLDTILYRADKALYQSKETGRSRYTVL